MSVTRQRPGPRELVACDRCTRLDRRWQRLELRVDGELVLELRVCRACKTSLDDALRDVLDG